MTFLVQTDNGTVDNANAYITAAEMRAYWLDRGLDLSAVLDGPLQQAIVKATQHLDTAFNYIGIRVNQEQGTQWPRVGAENRDGFPVTDIPQVVKNACAEYANRARTAELTPDPTYDPSGQAVIAKATSVGPISKSVQYSNNGGAYILPKYPTADRLLFAEGLVEGGSSRSMVRA